MYFFVESEGEIRFGETEELNLTQDSKHIEGITKSWGKASSLLTRETSEGELTWCLILPKSRLNLESHQ